MSVEQEVSDIISGAASSSKDEATIARALEEVKVLLGATDDSMQSICLGVEGASSRDAVRQAFRRLNGIMGIFVGLELAPENNALLFSAITSLGLSGRLESFLESAFSLREALTSYKRAVLQQLAVSFRQREEQRRVVEGMDDELFSQFLPEPGSPLSEVEDILSVLVSSPKKAEDGKAGSRKRGVSGVGALSTIPKKKSKVPELASVERVMAESSIEGTPKKKILMTRERLRAGTHDPKGLLDLVDSSTNALERTKKLELLKTAGFGFNAQGSKSFADKLNAATLRLDLGVGGHSVGDSLLFGAKVLSSQRSLSTKNISDVENSVIVGKTTWKHQEAYVKRLIAGSLNQAKRIFEKYDEILYGSVPEIQVEETHSSIRGLLDSEDCKKFFELKDSEVEADVGICDDFVKRIIESVAPILPISLRNKSLDGGYLRTALHLLGAAEFMFKQYEADIRMQANPAGAVGMFSSMHAEFERATIYNEELKVLGDFMKDMRTQYQTSFGLGASFAHDSHRSRKRTRGSRGRSFYDNRHFQNQGMGFARMTNPSFPESYLGAGGRGRGVRLGGGRGSSDIPALRARGICFDYRAGVCGRGGACRFHHSNQ